MNLPEFTIDDIRAFDPKPCYDPARYLPEGWSGNALDILAVGECPASNRLWVVLHSECIPSETLNLFARKCALSVAHLWEMPDIVRQYLETGDETLRDAALNACRYVSEYAAEAAAQAAAQDTSPETSRVAAYDAAQAAACDARNDKAWYAARDAQIAILIELLS